MTDELIELVQYLEPDRRKDSTTKTGTASSYVWGAWRIALVLRLTCLCSTSTCVIEGRDIDSMSILLLPFMHHPVGNPPHDAQTTIQSLRCPAHQRPSRYDQVSTILCRYVVGVVFLLITLTIVTNKSRSIWQD